MKLKKEYKIYIMTILFIIFVILISLFVAKKINMKNKITKENYKCPEGYILKNEKCEKKILECPSDSYLVESGECIKSLIEYTCPLGYELYNETKCLNKKEVKYIYTCDEGYELYNETKCKSKDKVVDAIKKIDVKNSDLKEAKQNFKVEKVNKVETTKAINPTKKSEKINIDSISLSSAKTIYGMNYDLNNEYTNISVHLLPENVSTKVTCTSSNSEVIKLHNSSYSIKNSGRLSVESSSPGVATITCTTSNGKKGSITITICEDEKYNGIKCEED